MTTKASLKGLPGKVHRISRQGPRTFLRGHHTPPRDPRMSPQGLLTRPDRQRGAK
ncbi:hypothetical protein IMZ48_31150 [Candidatus Bathyarchaeota archaeon]|nr:hypothetical protein [Candidatus Bathyarchaeota archaeon]